MDNSESWRGHRIRVLEGALEEIIRKTRRHKDPVIKDLYFVAVMARHGKEVSIGEEIRDDGRRIAS